MALKIPESHRRLYIRLDLYRNKYRSARRDGDQAAQDKAVAEMAKINDQIKALGKYERFHKR